MVQRIFVAASSQHVGKTTSTLGLVFTLRRLGYQVGYCKPVGQEYIDLGSLKVDKDALLFSTFMDFELFAKYHSPVIVGGGLTKAYLENPGAFNFKSAILEAAQHLESENEIVVYEGTGHPGVGSVLDISNAEVAKLLGASVILIVEGGIGKTIDQINANLALFREQDIPILGVIINKVIPEKIDQVRYYVGKKLQKMKVPLLGILPFDATLANPIMETIKIAVNGLVLCHEDRLDNRVESIVSGSLVEKKEFEGNQNILLIVNYKRLDKAIAIIKEITKKNDWQNCPIAGIIINGEGNVMPGFDSILPSMDYINEYKIPVVSTSLDTYGSAVKISHIEVKINTRTPWKAARAAEMIQEQVDFEQILKKA